MILYLMALAIYFSMHVYSHRRISLLFGLSGKGKKILTLILLLINAVYFIPYFLQFTFSINTYFLQFAGLIWLHGLPGICAAGFVDAGFAMIRPDKTRLRKIVMTLLSLLYILALFRWIHYGRPLVHLHYFSSGSLRLAIYFAVLAALYKIITISLQSPDRRKGWLLVFFSLGAYAVFMGFGIATMSALFGFYAIVYARLTTGFKLKKRSRRVCIALMVLGFVISIPHMSWWGNGLGIPVLYFTGGLWYGMMMMAAVLFLLESAVSMPFRLPPRITVTAALAILLLAGGYSVANGLRAPVVKKVTVSPDTMPKEANPFTIVQLSDLHLGDLLSPAWLEKTVDKVNALSPDIIVFTGDMIDKGFRRRSDRYTAALARLSAKHGIFAVTGNHEYYNNRLPMFLELCKKLDIRVLRNQNTTLSNGIQLAGINEPTGREYNDKAPSLTDAFKGIDFNKPVIFLSHHPGFFRFAVRWGVDLQLSGHTHAGQIPPMDVISYLWYTYFYGLYQEGNSYIHTSCGTGLVIVPMRLFSRNEITLITLISSKKQPLDRNPRLR
jgi:predicted MPP superfamily phosphohydrolase